MDQIQTCDRCESKALGKYHTFFYGNVLSKTTVGTGSTLTFTTYLTTTKYRIEGEGRAFICKSCVRKYTISWLAAILLATPFLIALIKSAKLLNIKVFTFITIMICGIVFVILLGSLLHLPSGIKYAGNNLAIRVKKKEYKKLGYDVLLNPREYKKLKKDWS
jgi:hypothetical protein